MPNTKSAERRSRSSATKKVRNQAAKSKLKTLEQNYLDLAKTGNSEAATKALNLITSALDKAAKGGVIHRRNANRKKSRLTIKLAPKAPKAS